ncbi:hypothetical protein C0J45_8069 [Silurus meridionalis]|nr:hypothetical protein C0J45_8069 [Silurus meridionalis]
MSEQPSSEFSRPRRRTQPPSHLKDYEVKYYAQRSHEQEEETQLSTMRDESSVLPPDYTNSLPLSSHAEDIDAITDADIQHDRPWLTTQPFKSDEEEEPSSQEEESALTPMCHDMENRQLREDKAAILEELRELKVLYNNMQKLTVKLLAPRRHRVRETSVSLPPNINKPPAAPKPVPYTPQTSPRKHQVPPTKDYVTAEHLLFHNIQQDSCPEEYEQLSSGKLVSPTSRLLTLAPEFDKASQLTRVGGRLRRAKGLELQTVHPIVLDPHHRAIKLLIQDYDSKVCHPGPERVFTKLRRSVWIRRKWKAKPEDPKMADLSPARWRLHKPSFYSTGMDCFGPFPIKIGRRLEKRWGIIFKGLTTRSVHIELPTAIDTDSFLMALRRCIAHRGTPSELISDQGTNFQGGERELRDALKNCSQELQRHAAKQKIEFRFNPPNASHFGGSWERAIRSIKNALRTVVGAQTVTEEVLQTVLIEIEGILNSKPLGYVSSNVADLDSITPNLLLMGRLDSSLPQECVKFLDVYGVLLNEEGSYTEVLATGYMYTFIEQPTWTYTHSLTADVLTSHCFTANTKSSCCLDKTSKSNSNVE